MPLPRKHDQVTPADLSDPVQAATKINIMLNNLQDRIDELAGYHVPDTVTSLADLPSVGNKLMVPLYNDYTVPGLALARPAAGSPTLTAFRGDVDAYAFGGSSGTDEAFFSIHVLHDMKKDTEMTFHVHWSHIVAAPSGNVKWTIDFTTARGYGIDVFPAQTTMSTTQTAGPQYTHHISPDDDMTVTIDHNIEPDSILLGRVSRNADDAADTFANDAYLLNMDLHYQQGQLGTTERNRAWLSADYSSSIA